jgi:putative flippase GtrA
MNCITKIRNWLTTHPSGRLVAQFIRFGLVGLTNTALSYGIYALILWLGGHYILASVVSFVISVAWSFLLNNRFVFRKATGETRVWWKTLLKTYLSYGVTGLLLANALLYLWIDVLSVNQYIAFLLNLVITIPANFLLNRFWAFRTDAAVASQECIPTSAQKD